MNTGNLSARGQKKVLITSGNLVNSEASIEQTVCAPVTVDAVADSHDALLLNEAFHTAQNTPDVRIEKVKALKERIANGTYEIDIHQLAVNLLREEAPIFEV